MMDVALDVAHLIAAILIQIHIRPTLIVGMIWLIIVGQYFAGRFHFGHIIFRRIHI